MAVSFLLAPLFVADCSAFAARETRTHAQWFKFELSVKKARVICAERERSLRDSCCYHERETRFNSAAHSSQVR